MAEPLSIAPAAAWGSSAVCTGCNKRFFALRPERHCHACGVSLCQTCRNGDIQLRLCGPCGEHARALLPSSGPDGCKVSSKPTSPTHDMDEAQVIGEYDQLQEQVVELEARVELLAAEKQSQESKILSLNQLLKEAKQASSNANNLNNNHSKNNHQAAPALDSSELAALRQKLIVERARADEEAASAGQLRRQLAALASDLEAANEALATAEQSCVPTRDPASITSEERDLDEFEARLVHSRAKLRETQKELKEQTVRAEQAERRMQQELEEKQALAASLDQKVAEHMRAVADIARLQQRQSSPTDSPRRPSAASQEGDAASARRISELTDQLEARAADLASAKAELTRLSSELAAARAQAAANTARATTDAQSGAQRLQEQLAEAEAAHRAAEERMQQAHSEEMSRLLHVLAAAVHGFDSDDDTTSSPSMTELVAEIATLHAKSETLAAAQAKLAQEAKDSKGYIAQLEQKTRAVEVQLADATSQLGLKAAKIETLQEELERQASDEAIDERVARAEEARAAVEEALDAARIEQQAKAAEFEARERSLLKEASRLRQELEAAKAAASRAPRRSLPSPRVAAAGDARRRASHPASASPRVLPTPRQHKLPPAPTPGASPAPRHLMTSTRTPTQAAPGRAATATRRQTPATAAVAPGTTASPATPPRKAVLADSPPLSAARTTAGQSTLEDRMSARATGANGEGSPTSTRTRAVEDIESQWEPETYDPSEDDEAEQVAAQRLLLTTSTDPVSSPRASSHRAQLAASMVALMEESDDDVRDFRAEDYPSEDDSEDEFV
eukprot:m.304739 g.304739  ORF g.304739 m.304739 type:complete len:796 (+) comp17273_c0_seq1:51-2438(+)